MKVDLKNATIKIYDGSPVPNELEVKIGEGNFTWTETYNREYSLDKGKLDTVRNGDETPLSVTMDFVWEWIKAQPGQAPTVVDALKQRGEAADWVSSSSDPCEPYSVDLELFIDPECNDGSYAERIYFSDFRQDTLDHDPSEGSIACTGQCNITEPTITREPVS